MIRENRTRVQVAYDCIRQVLRSILSGRTGGGQETGQAREPQNRRLDFRECVAHTSGRVEECFEHSEVL